MRITVDLGFSSLLLVAVVCVVVPAIGFVVRRKWRRAAERAEEIRRLLVLAAEESARAESEASYQYGTVSVSKNGLCAVCFCPTTAHCARCKAVHYCSGKCQIVHWRQGHKEECHPPSTTRLSDNLVSDIGKKTVVPDHPKDGNFRVESPAEGIVTDSNSELSSNSFSGFSASASASESSDNSSLCESITSNDQEKSQRHIFTEPTHGISDTISNGNIISGATPLSPKFASLVDSVDGYSTIHKLNQVRPDFRKEEDKLASNNNSGMSMQKRTIVEPPIVSSGFWNRTLDSKGIKDDSISQPFPFHSDDSFPKSVGNNVPFARSISVENEGVDSSGCADVMSSHKLLKVGSKVSNHVVTNPGSTLKSAESGCLPHAFPDTKLVSQPEEHSHDSSKWGNNGIQTGTATPSQVISCSPNSKNGLKTSVLKAVDQFRGSNVSKHIPPAVESDIIGRYSDKGLFPYDFFVKLYNWNRVELRPFGLINCGNSCYANAVLQCLAFTPPLTAYFLQGLHSKSCANKQWCFTCEFESLVLKSKETKAPLSPMGILSHLQNIGSQLGNGREEDVHEFLRLSVETMQSVCLMETGDTQSNILKEETNLMGLTFGGYLRSKVKCMKCGGKSEHQERMMDLTVEIEGEIATLEEALRQFTTTETLDGENKYRCDRCESYEKAKKKMTVSEAPNVLTIALKRFQSGKFGKLNKPIRFPEILDLAPFMSGTSDLPIYRLYGVVVHLDIMNSAFSGHYVCYVKNFQNRWFEVNDSVVTAVGLDRVLAKGAYMLFYARCSPRAPRSIRNIIVSSDSTSKVNGRRVKMKSKYAYTNSSAAENRTSSISPDGSSSLETMYSKFHHLRRILEEDSSSDNSSLISSTSDEGSCSTDTTYDSTSTDDFADCVFGDSGRCTVRNPNSDTSSALLSPSDMDQYDSIFPRSNGLRPPAGPRAEIDSLLYRSRPLDTKSSVGGVSYLHRYTFLEHRKFDTSRSSSSFRDTESLQRAGSNHFNDKNSGISCRKSRDRTD